MCRPGTDMGHSPLIATASAVLAGRRRATAIGITSFDERRIRSSIEEQGSLKAKAVGASPTGSRWKASHGTTVTVFQLLTAGAVVNETGIRLVRVSCSGPVAQQIERMATDHQVGGANPPRVILMRMRL